MAVIRRLSLDTRIFRVARGLGIRKFRGVISSSLRADMVLEFLDWW